MASSSGNDVSYGTYITNNNDYATPLGRKSSVIVPSSGMRISRPNTYSDLRSDSESDSENEPLLRNGRRRGSTSGRRHKNLRKACRRVWNFAKSPPAKMAIKCSFGYLLGSLATFVRPVANVLGPYEGKHLVATFCVYFHPARSYGSMFQATIYALTAFAYSTAVSVGSMGVSALFDNLDLIALGHALVLILFCGGGLGLIGYVKLIKSHPTVSVACSLASMSIITILTKEGSIQRGDFDMGKIAQVSMILTMSIIISNLLAFTIWPSSAVSDLRQLMIECNDSFSDSLSRITKSFLTGSDEEIQSSKFVAAAENRRTVFSSLLKNLMEAKYEHYFWGTENEYHQEKLLVESMQRLSQNIGGLRSAALTQFGLLKQIEKASGQPIPQAMVNSDTGFLFTPPDHGKYLSVVEEDEEESSTARSSASSMTGGSRNEPSSPFTVHQHLIRLLGPPMESLVFTLTEMLDDLPFGPAPAYKVDINPNFDESLAKAIDMYSTKRTEALNALYRDEVVTQNRSLDEDADVAEIIAASGYFAFNLQYFAEEMSTFLDTLDELQRLQEQKPRTWEWVKFWKKWGKKGRRTDEELPRVTRNPQSEFAPPQRRKTIPNVSPQATVPLSYKFWKALRIFRSDHVKFTLKVGAGAALFALPSFLPATRETYSHWRGEWGLVSYMIIISMTLGQTNNSGEARVIGTVIGAVLAIVAWILFPRNPYGLAIYGWIVCLPCFWIILTWKQATFGRFILLTYNLSALYAYSLSTHEEYGGDEGGVDPLITQIALHRFVAVTVGVVWGLFVNRMVWPISARRQLRKGLSVLWLKMATIWSQDPLEVLLRDNDSFSRDTHRKYRTIADEHSLQKDLVALNTIAKSAPHEFRLKGPFPVKEYAQIQKTNQGVLDAFHSLNVMIKKDPKPNSREAEILEFTKRERHNLSTRISHLFYVLGSSIRIGFPLPETLPNTVSSRDRLLARLFDYRKQLKGDLTDPDEDFALIYAYALVTARVSEGLEELIRIMGQLYGSLEEEMLEV